jgi:hippurate hydrolase
MTATSLAADLRSWQEPLYKDLHSHPELSMEEERTAGIVADKLSDLGCEVQRIGGGVVGILRNGEGRTVLFRADMDGLPVREATGAEFASTVTVTQDGREIPVMHACGHDFHVVAGLGAVSVLAADLASWSGTLVAVFQPGEEKAAGAQSMLDDGLADKIPTPDIALAQHVVPGPPAGSVGITAGPVFSASSSVRVRIKGKGGHGSMPHLAIDPVVIAASLTLELQTIVARELAPGEFGVVTVGSLTAGTAANIIPDDAELLINVRAYSEEVKEQILASIKRKAIAACESANTPEPPEVEFYQVYPLTVNDDDAAAAVRRSLVEALGADRVEAMTPLQASEDFSIIPDALGIPYVYWVFGAFEPGQPVVGNHNPGFLPVLQPTLATGTQAAVAAIKGQLSAEVQRG